MTAVEVCRKIVETSGALLTRPTEGQPGMYDTKPFFQGSKRGWVLVDLFSASVYLKVHDALNDTNRAKFAEMDLIKAVKIAYKLLEKR